MTKTERPRHGAPIVIPRGAFSDRRDLGLQQGSPQPEIPPRCARRDDDCAGAAFIGHLSWSFVIDWSLGLGHWPFSPTLPVRICPQGTNPAFWSVFRDATLVTLHRAPGMPPCSRQARLISWTRY